MVCDPDVSLCKALIQFVFLYSTLFVFCLVMLAIELRRDWKRRKRH